MAEGDYPFLVYVWNTFEPINGPTLSVTFNHWANGKKVQNDNAEPKRTNTYNIQPGDMIGFPLYWNDETLEIRFNPSRGEITGTYYISLAPKGIWISNQLTSDGDKMEWIRSGLGQYIGNTEWGEDKAGIWKITDQDLSWTLTFRKLRPDPETTNITVGPVIL